MGFMSWERFRCDVDCAKVGAENCISEKLYKAQADALIAKGLAEVGYTQVSIDDCWSKGRDGNTKELLADPDRFPSGMKSLGDYLHERG